ncbi:ABC transporter substrate-binding protein [Ancylobacter sp. A5.8]|uniref:ABC transporter substrate-binding protein n=1 Tax=Ancylobacter gelatini TaxID=2919920 RepID=UPI001F4ED77F|nr:ABC transporter substrate-binding protein [Ancylobacter gelatini]MCJ8145023.1 ABC transporter substrate-binding protein [Ancylobacter gelatini]
MMISKRSFCLSAAAGAFLLAAGSASAPAQTLRNVTFVQPSPSAINSFPVYVAMGEGYFKDEGINMRVESVNGSGAVIQAMASGQAQFGRPGPGPVLSARARGVDVVFLYNMMVKSSFGIVVKDGDSFKSPTDLKGKVIGVGTADGAEVSFARGVLSSLGMEEKRDYTFLTVGDGGMATAAFTRDDISAYAASTADAAILSHRGIKLRDITPVEFVTFFGNGFAVMQETIDKDPKLVEGFGRAVVRAQEFAVDPANREKVLAHLKAGMPQESEDKAFANALFEQVLAKTMRVDQSKGWGYQNPKDWEAWHVSLVETGSLKQPMPDLEKAYTNAFVEVWNK